MQTTPPRFIFPQKGTTILITLILFIAATAWGIYGGFSYQPSQLFMGLYSISIGSALAIWVYRDSRSNKFSFGLDQSMYVFFAWPIVFPVYIFRVYGFRHGILILLAFLGIYIATVVWAIFLVFFLTIARTILAGS